MRKRHSNGQAQRPGIQGIFQPNLEGARYTCMTPLIIKKKFVREFKRRKAKSILFASVYFSGSSDRMGDFSKIRAHRRVYIQLSVGDGRSRGLYGKGLFPVLSYRNNRRRNRCRISPWHGYRNRRGRSSLVEQDSLRCFPAVSGHIEQPSKNGSPPS